MQKILVCGSVNGSASKIYNRITKLQQKAGNFDALLCCGEFFNLQFKDDISDYISGKKSVPLQTYILGPSAQELAELYGPAAKSGGEICRNLFALGKSGLYKMSGGLTIAYLSGTLGSDEVNYSEEDVHILIAKLQKNIQETGSGCDILITYEWPLNVSRFATPLPGDDCGSRLVSVLAAIAKPQYHFAGNSNHYYERAPYRNHRQFEHVAARDKVLTRFIALGHFAEPQSIKTLYAFRITPRNATTEETGNSEIGSSTESPYFDLVDEFLAQSQLRNSSQRAGGSDRGGDAGGGKQFFYDEAAMRRMGKRRHDGDGRGDGNKRRMGGPRVITSDECWFCLGAPNVSKHLVAHVGEHAYLALPKGPLVEAHVLIIPIGHIASIVAAPDDAVREIERYKAALRAMFATDDQIPVFYERNYRSQHLQIQVVPLRKELGSSLKSALLDFGRSFARKSRDEGSESEFFVEVPKNTDLKQAFGPNEPYFYVELPTGEKLVHRVNARRQTPFPVQFGREMLSCPALLNTPNRIDWHSCAQSVDEETSATQKFREKFTPFDFLDSDS